MKKYSRTQLEEICADTFKKTPGAKVLLIFENGTIFREDQEDEAAAYSDRNNLTVHKIEKDARAKAKAAEEAKAKAEAEAKIKAAKEAKEKAEKEAKAKAEKEAEEKAEAKAEQEAEAQAERKAEEDAEAQEASALPDPEGLNSPQDNTTPAPDPQDQKQGKKPKK